MDYKESNLPVSAAAEYLTFVAGSGEGSVEVRYENENIWLTQKMMAELYGIDRSVVTKHLKKIFLDNELDEGSVCAIFAHTAAEIIVERAAAGKENMGLTTWKAAPEGKIQKFDVSIAKSYLDEREIDFLNRLVSLYLDYAEIQAENHIPMTMEDWANRLDSFIEFNGRELLMDAGKVSAEQAKLYAETQFEKYRIVQDKLFESDFDHYLEMSEE